MQSVCRHCRALASTEYPCKVCGSDSSMSHTHCTEEFHYMLPPPHIAPDPDKHYYETCSETHTHAHLGNHDHAEDGSIVGDAKPIGRPFKEREAYLLTAPWVTRIKGKVQCDGTTGGSMHSPNRCKKMGKYKYRALKRSFARSGNYCWDHLPMFMGGDELERWEKFIAKNPPPWKEKPSDAAEGTTATA